MADFEKAFPVVMKYETSKDNPTGYVHDPDDPGGETIFGVSRRFNPDSTIWSVIDGARNDPDFPGWLAEDDNFMAEVQRIYKTRYWDAFAGDEIADQGIANELFDQVVNMKSYRVFEHLQRALNVLNRDSLLWENIEVDGYFGPVTLDTLEKAITKGQAWRIVNLLNILQGAYYICRMEENPTMQKYVGWYDRVEIKKRRK